LLKINQKLSSTTENTIKKLFLNTSAGKQKVIEGQVKFRLDLFVCVCFW